MSKKREREDLHASLNLKTDEFFKWCDQKKIPSELKIFDELDKFLLFELPLNSYYSSENILKIKEFKLKLTKFISCKLRTDITLGYYFFKLILSSSHLEHLAVFAYRLWRLACFYQKAHSPSTFISPVDKKETVKHFSKELDRYILPSEESVLLENNVSAMHKFETYEPSVKKSKKFRIERKSEAERNAYTRNDALTDFNKTLYLKKKRKNATIHDKNITDTLRCYEMPFETKFNDELESSLESQYCRMLYDLVAFLMCCEVNPQFKTKSFGEFRDDKSGLDGQMAFFDAQTTCVGGVWISDYDVVDRVVRHCISMTGAYSGSLFTDYTANGTFRNFSQFKIADQITVADRGGLIKKQKRGSGVLPVEFVVGSTDTLKSILSGDFQTVRERPRAKKRKIFSPLATLTVRPVNCDILAVPREVCASSDQLRVNSIENGVRGGRNCQSSDLTLRNEQVDVDCSEAIYLSPSHNGAVDVGVCINVVTDASQSDSSCDMSGAIANVPSNVDQSVVPLSRKCLEMAEVTVDSLLTMTGCVRGKPGDDVADVEAVSPVIIVLKATCSGMGDASVGDDCDFFYGGSDLNNSVDSDCQVCVVTDVVVLSDASEEHPTGQQPHQVLPNSVDVLSLSAMSLFDPDKTYTQEPPLSGPNPKVNLAQPAGIDNITNTMCYVTSAIQVLYHNPVFRNLLGNMGITSEKQGKIVKYLKDVFAELDVRKGSSVDLVQANLHYFEFLSDWCKEGEENSATEAVALLFRDSVSVGDGRANSWFGGQMLEYTLFTEKGEEFSRLEEKSDRLTSTVVLTGDGSSLQDCFDQCYSTEVEPTENVELERGGTVWRGQAKRFIKFKTCPSILSVEVVRDQFNSEVTTSAKLKQFYHSLTYSMELDVSRAMSRDHSMPCCEYHLVALIARRTAWTKAGQSEGHYKAVVSVLSPVGAGIQWWMCNDELVEAIVVDDVLRFTGGAGSQTDGPYNKKCARENKMFVDCFQFVRKDRLDDFYAGNV